MQQRRGWLTNRACRHPKIRFAGQCKEVFVIVYQVIQETTPSSRWRELTPMETLSGWLHRNRLVPNHICLANVMLAISACDTSSARGLAVASYALCKILIPTRLAWLS